MTDIKQQDVEALIELFDASSWTELRIKLEDFELHLNKDASVRRRSQNVAAAPAASEATPVAASSQIVDAPLAPPAASALAPAQTDVPDGLTVLRAPNLGTFYRSPKPGAPFYVEIGQHVDADTDVCLIEVMKLFTPVKAGTSGIVRKILVNDAELVEFDQPLFLIEPANS